MKEELDSLLKNETCLPMDNQKDKGCYGVNGYLIERELHNNK